MRILIATPLFPPDNAEVAAYVKELAGRLAKEHEVAIVAYARLPEPVKGARIIAIDKRAPLLMRLARYFFALYGAARRADIMYAENGSSAELPVALVSLLTGIPLVFHIGDAGAHEHAQGHAARRFIESLARRRARSVLDTSPLARPDIIPFLPLPAESERAYEQSWSEHLARVDTLLRHG